MRGTRRAASDGVGDASAAGPAGLPSISSSTVTPSVSASLGREAVSGRERSVSHS